MRIGPFSIAFREAVKPAPVAPPSFEERLERVEDGLNKIADEFEGVLDRINRWSARQAAQKRVQAIKALDEATTPTEGEIVAPTASEAVPDPDALSPLRRAALKAALRRKALGA